MKTNLIYWDEGFVYEILGKDSFVYEKTNFRIQYIGNRFYIFETFLFLV